MKKIIVILPLSLVLSVLSGFYQRSSGELVQWGNMCRDEYVANCYHQRLSGGFPFAFIFDSPGISVENTIAPEDKFRWLPFITDIWFYFMALVFSISQLKQLRKL